MSTAEFIAAEIYNGYCPFLAKFSKKIWPRHGLLQHTNTISSKCYCHHFKELHLLLKDYISSSGLVGKLLTLRKKRDAAKFEQTNVLGKSWFSSRFHQLQEQEASQARICQAACASGVLSTATLPSTSQNICIKLKLFKWILEKWKC